MSAETVNATTDSTWAPPRLSWRFIPVWRRNFLVWQKLFVERLLTNVVEPLLTIAAFGYGLGSLLPQVDGVSYLQFLASGSIAMSVMYSAKFESLWGAFSRMHVQKTWDAILHTPLAVDDLLLGEMIWAASKATFTAFCILVMIWLLGIAREPLSVLVLPCAFFIALVFSAMALIVNAVARSYDLLSNYFTVVVMPLVFLSGVYFPLTQLPDWLRTPAEWLPVTAAVNLVRPLALGRWPVEPARDLLLLAAWGAVCFALALGLTRRRLLK
ncbi:MAG TPA: ABC transporter permease [Burkholderiaceae bacterium]|nr:ABC transporter permease [Burkholderiaceae bacterium]